MKSWVFFLNIFYIIYEPRIFRGFFYEKHLASFGLHIKSYAFTFVKNNYKK